VAHRAGYAFEPDLAARLMNNKRSQQGDVKMVTACEDMRSEVETGCAIGCTCGHAEEDHEGGYGRCMIEGCPCTSYEPDEGLDWVLEEDEGLYE
jgi:hypothetical protein